METRSLVEEVMDDPEVSEDTLADVYRTLRTLHRLFGNHRAVLRALRRNPRPVRRVLDLGCGDGSLLDVIRRKLSVEVLGVDSRPPRSRADVPVICADAVRERLPEADVAVAVCLIHHLSDADLIALIHNVGRSCRRFVIVDLVRHRLPRDLFRLGVVPWVNPVSAIDGVRSIERSFTPGELRDLVRSAVGAHAWVRHSVAPFYVRQVVDIVY
jgi:SAM-dependent methyltransferase